MRAFLCGCLVIVLVLLQVQISTQQRQINAVSRLADENAAQGKFAADLIFEFLDSFEELQTSFGELEQRVDSLQGPIGSPAGVAPEAGPDAADGVAAGTL